MLLLFPIFCLLDTTRVGKVAAIMNILYFQCTDGVEYSENGDSYIGKDRHPHRAQPKGGEYQYSNLDTYGEPDILSSNGNRTSSDTDGYRNPRWTVVHNYDVGRFDGSVTAKAPLRYPHRRGQVQAHR